MRVLVKAAARGLGPQCPLLAPKSSVDPLTGADPPRSRGKRQNSEGEAANAQRKIIGFLSKVT